MTVEVVDIPTHGGRVKYSGLFDKLLSLPRGKALKIEGVAPVESRQRLLCALRARTKYRWKDGSVVFCQAARHADGLAELYVWLSSAFGGDENFLREASHE
jgi:hypothetical protein